MFVNTPLLFTGGDDGPQLVSAPMDTPPTRTRRMLRLRFTVARADQPIIAAAMMMQMPSTTAAAMTAAATFCFSTISLCKSPGVNLSNSL